jgi:hypothetical protein
MEAGTRCLSFPALHLKSSCRVACALHVCCAVQQIVAGVACVKNQCFCGLLLLLASACVSAAAADAPVRLPVDFAGEPASADARYAAQWVAANADNQGRPFAVVDKRGARLFVFEADGRLRGATSVLLGLGVGDQSVPGIARRDLASLRPHERTTPSGRFVSEPGHNSHGEDIVWVDYNAKVAIHRLRSDAASLRDRRAQRLASTAIEDNRISMGCIVVPVGFYDSVVRPLLGKGYGLVYVLPETRPVESLFGAVELSLAQR